LPSRKQRRRREKLQRHEYEYVLETEEGEEIPLESARQAREAAQGKAEGDTRAKTVKGPTDRRGRPMAQPSFQRVFKRTAIFAPLIALFIYLTSRNDDNFTIGGLLFTVLLLILFFMPFSYMIDVLVYRMATRRQERERGAKRS
jgi:hypothetical protein